MPPYCDKHQQWYSRDDTQLTQPLVCHECQREASLRAYSAPSIGDELVQLRAEHGLVLDRLLAIAALVNAYYHDQRPRTAYATLQAIAEALSDPF